MTDITLRVNGVPVTLQADPRMSLLDLLRAAVANAVWHATGLRIRDLPITPAKLLAPPG